jgi:hypothetical protein
MTNRGVVLHEADQLLELVEVELSQTFLVVQRLLEAHVGTHLSRRDHLMLALDTRPTHTHKQHSKC